MSTYFWWCQHFLAQNKDFWSKKGYNFKWSLLFTGYFKINEINFKWKILVLYAQKLNFYLYCFYDGKILCWNFFCFKKHHMTSPHKIVINVDIGMLLTWRFQKTFKTKFGLLKNCSRPNAKLQQAKSLP